MATRKSTKEGAVAAQPNVREAQGAIALALAALDDIGAERERVHCLLSAATDRLQADPADEQDRAAIAICLVCEEELGDISTLNYARGFLQRAAENLAEATAAKGEVRHG